MPINPFKILGIRADASSGEIRSAYRRLALAHHPDKGGSPEKWLQLQRAHLILTDDEERAKWDRECEEDGAVGAMAADKILISSPAKRRSEISRRVLQILSQRFTEHPASLMTESKRHEAFKGIDDLVGSGLLDKAYFSRLYRPREAATDYHDLYQLVAHNTRWAREPTVDPAFFQRVLTPAHALKILSDFLRGKCYGTYLTKVKTYLNGRIDLSQPANPDMSLYKAVLAIVSASDFSADIQSILSAINGIYESVSQRRRANDPLMICLMQDKYFRFFVAQALTHYWKVPDPSVALKALQGIKVDRTSRLNAYGRMIARIEKRLETVFSKPPSEIALDDVYECGYLMIDLFTCDGGLTRINATLMAALCFQYAAKIEPEASRAMAAEHLALQLYQGAIQGAYDASAFATLYTLTHVVKYLSEFRFAVMTIDIDEVLAELMQAGDAAVFTSTGPVVKTMQAAMRRAMYLVDVLPCFVRLKPTVELFPFSMLQLGLLRHSLHQLLEQQPLQDFRYAKVLYQVYEDSLLQTVREQENAEENLQLRMQTIHALLAESGTRIEQMAHLLDVPYSHMRRDDEGWLEPVDELDLPAEEAGIKIFKSFDGFEINQETGEIKIICQEWTPGDPRRLRLFTEYDVYQMIIKGISNGFLSLDHADVNKRYSPLQAVRFAPAELEGTEYLKTLFMTDYLLKMFSTGAEILGRPPYAIRSSAKLLERLPKHLRDILSVCAEARGKPRMHRFWIENGNIQRQEQEEGAVTKVYYGQVEMKIKKHLLHFGEDGDLTDKPGAAEEDDASAEAQFARGFSEHYDEIAQYFPEFRRLKELTKIAGAILELKLQRENNNIKINYGSLLLHDEPLWERKKQTLLKAYLAKLQPIYDSLPEPVKHLDNATWWQGKQAEILQKFLAELNKISASFPKFVYAYGDSEVEEVYQKLYRANYDRLYEQNYRENYDRLKKLNCEHAGEEFWSRHEAAVVESIKTEVAQSIRKLLDENLSKQHILDSMNADYASERARLYSSFYGQVVEVRSSIGEAAYSAAIHAFLDKNCRPLAQARAEHCIKEMKQSAAQYRCDWEAAHDVEFKPKLDVVAYKQSIADFWRGNVRSLATVIVANQISEQQHELADQIAVLQRLEDSFHAMSFNQEGKVAAKAVKHLRVPAVFHRKPTGTKVYGGVSINPRFMATDSLCLDYLLSDSSAYGKRSAIEKAESYVSEVKMRCSSLFSRGSIYFEAQARVQALESKIASARRDLWWLEEREKQEAQKRFAPFYQPPHIELFDYTRAVVSQYVAEQETRDTGLGGGGGGGGSASPSPSILHRPKPNGPKGPSYPDPLPLFRLENDYKRRAEEQKAARESIQSGVMSVMLQYTMSRMQQELVSAFNRNVSAAIGVGRSLYKTLYAAFHPYDCILKPIGQFAYDAAIIGAAHVELQNLKDPTLGSQDPDLAAVVEMRRILAENPHIYEESRSNMQQRLENIRQGINHYAKADDAEKAGIEAEIITDVVTGEVIFKAISWLSATARTMKLQPQFRAQPPAAAAPVESGIRVRGGNVAEPLPSAAPAVSRSAAEGARMTENLAAAKAPEGRPSVAPAASNAMTEGPRMSGKPEINRVAAEGRPSAVAPPPPPAPPAPPASSATTVRGRILANVKESRAARGASRFAVHVERETALKASSVRAAASTIPVANNMAPQSHITAPPVAAKGQFSAAAAPSAPPASSATTIRGRILANVKESRVARGASRFPEHVAAEGAIGQPPLPLRDPILFPLVGGGRGPAVNPLNAVAEVRKVTPEFLAEMAVMEDAVMLYAADASGELRMVNATSKRVDPQGRVVPNTRTGGLDRPYHPEKPSHADLFGGQPVRVAGMLHVQSGKPHFINNLSQGLYETGGPHLWQETVAIFREHGLDLGVINPKNVKFIETEQLPVHAIRPMAEASVARGGGSGVGGIGSGSGGAGSGTQSTLARAVPNVNSTVSQGRRAVSAVAAEGQPISAPPPAPLPPPVRRKLIADMQRRTHHDGDEDKSEIRAIFDRITDSDDSADGNIGGGRNADSAYLGRTASEGKAAGDAAGFDSNAHERAAGGTAPNVMSSDGAGAIVNGAAVSSASKASFSNTKYHPVSLQSSESSQQLFSTSTTPISFPYIERNAATNLLHPIAEVKTVTSEFRTELAMKEDAVVLYAADERGELRVLDVTSTLTELGAAVLLETKPDNPGAYIDASLELKRPCQVDLFEGAPVKIAGMLRVKDGEVSLINSLSIAELGTLDNAQMWRETLAIFGEHGIKLDRLAPNSIRFMGSMHFPLWALMPEFEPTIADRCRSLEGERAEAQLPILYPISPDAGYVPRAAGMTVEGLRTVTPEFLIELAQKKAAIMLFAANAAGELRMVGRYARVKDKKGNVVMDKPKVRAYPTHADLFDAEPVQFAGLADFAEGKVVFLWIGFLGPYQIGGSHLQNSILDSFAQHGIPLSDKIRIKFDCLDLPEHAILPSEKSMQMAASRGTAELSMRSVPPCQTLRLAFLSGHERAKSALPASPDLDFGGVQTTLDRASGDPESWSLMGNLSVASEDSEAQAASVVTQSAHPQPESARKPAAPSAEGPLRIISGVKEQLKQLKGESDSDLGW